MKILYIPAVAALAGLLPMAYDGYTVVRIVVCSFLTYAGLRFKKEGSPNTEKIGTDEASLIFFVIAAVYNPIFPLHLNRGLWMLIDVAVAAYLFWIINLKPPEAEGTEKLVTQDVANTKLESVSKKADQFMSSILWTSLIGLCMVLFFMFLGRN